MGTEGALFSCLEGEVQCGSCSDLFTSSVLPEMKFLFSATTIDLCADWCKHITVEVSAFINFSRRYSFALCRRVL